jgi:hypothetical protein
MDRVLLPLRLQRQPATRSTPSAFSCSYTSANDVMRRFPIPSRSAEKGLGIELVDVSLHSRFSALGLITCLCLLVSCQSRLIEIYQYTSSLEYRSADIGTNHGGKIEREQGPSSSHHCYCFGRRILCDSNENDPTLVRQKDSRCC